MWEYRARIRRIVDGDTCDIIVDTGFHGRQVERLRLLRVDTPERGQVDWQRATDETKRWVAQAEVQYMQVSGKTPDADDFWPFVIRTEKADSFGRYLAEVWTTGGGWSLNDHLVASGWGVKP